MLYTIFTSMIFISEIIIAITLLYVLIRVDLRVIKLNKVVKILNPEIRQICKISRAISLQLKELAKIFVAKLKDKGENFSVQCLVKLLGTIILWRINLKLIKKMKHFKLRKFILKALSLAVNVI